LEDNQKALDPARSDNRYRIVIQKGKIKGGVLPQAEKGQGR
jgi:hypothetical protein